MPTFDSAPAALALVALAAYLLGSVPFGIVIARLFGLGDLRTIGSGNIGATNVLRTGNKLAAFLTLVLDAGKGAIAVLVARFAVGEDAAQLAGLFAFLGHIYPIYLSFRGGKGGRDVPRNTSGVVIFRRPGRLSLVADGSGVVSNFVAIRTDRGSHCSDLAVAFGSA